MEKFVSTNCYIFDKRWKPNMAARGRDRDSRMDSRLLWQKRTTIVPLTTTATSGSYLGITIMVIKLKRSYVSAYVDMCF